MSIRESTDTLSLVTRLAVVLFVGALLTGCPPPVPSYPFVPMHEAIRRVDDNNIKLASAAGGLKASPVDATIRFREREGGPVRQFTFSGVLGFHRPRDLILQLREGLGGTVVMQAGSNDHEYWLWVKPEIDTLWWGTYPKSTPESASSPEPAEGDEASGVSSHEPRATSAPGDGSTRPLAFSPESLDEMPIRPDDLIEVLGLSVISFDTTGPDGPIYRPEAERNVLIFLEYDEVGQGYIQKEYHIDRAAPYLVREVVFREPDGRIRMHAAVADHGPVRGSDALAARRIRIEWPSSDSWLELRIRRYTLETEPFLTPENPRTQGVRAKREVHVGATADEPIEIPPPQGGAM